MRKKAERKNKKTKNSGKKSFWKRCAALLFSGLSLKFFSVLLVVLLVYVVYLDATIRSSFEGKKWQIPARVYARPLELYQGLPLKINELIAELNDLGYANGSASSPGQYFRRGNEVVLNSRGFQFWDGFESSQLMRVQFSNSAVSGLLDGQGGAKALARLEPIEIGAIYPSHREDRILLQLNDVPPLLSAALVAVEDHRFYEHHGISIPSILRAAVANFRAGGYAQGGSTLTQQLVKNYYLTRERSLRRKFTEAIMSVLLEQHYSKEDILQAYLNEVYLGQAGARAIHGFGLGAQHYFNRPLHELSIEKLALMIAIIRGPAYYDPWRHPDRAIERRNRVLDTLASASIVSQEDVDWAKRQALGLGQSSKSHFAFPAYLDVVKQQLKQHYPQQVLTSEGLKIHTAFNPRLQRQAEKAVAAQLALIGDEELQGSAVLTEPSTGELLAIVGGREAGYAGFNRALNMQRSIGSVVKPFVYLTALLDTDRYTLATRLDDSPVEIVQADGSIWAPRNFDRRSHGQVPLIYALAHSYNQATARLGHELGIDRVVQTLSMAGAEVKFNAVPSLYIGTTQLSPLQVTQLYQSLASGGFSMPVRAIRAVLDGNDNAIQRFPYEIEQVYDERSIYLLIRAMEAVVREGSGRKAQYILGPSKRFVGKTGTSSEGRDAWFAGFTGDLLAVVWVGFDDNRATTLTGSSAALPIWANLVAAGSRRSLADVQPLGIVDAWVDKNSGEKSKARCANAMLIPFVAGTEPEGRAKCY